MGRWRLSRPAGARCATDWAMQFQPHAVRCALSILAMLIPACGGSSSETPPPERPDSWQLELRRPKVEANGAQSSRSHSVVQWGPEGRAASTWGKGGAPKKAVPRDAGIE